MPTPVSELAGTPVYRLSADGWVAEVAPALGGQISRLSYAGRDVLRPQTDLQGDILKASCFPLVPFANRIAHGRFPTPDGGMELEVFPDIDRHALHGIGWRSAWEIQALEESRMSWRLSYTGRDWPWNFSALQTLELSPSRARFGLAVQNDSPRSMPSGLGFHPYFPITAASEAAFTGRGAWACSDGLPTHRFKPDWLQQAAGPNLLALSDAGLIDHAVYGWNGEALLRHPSHQIRIRSSGCPFAQIFLPASDYMCIEPVTHRPDALNAPRGERAGVTWLAPGHRHSIAMDLVPAVRPAAQVGLNPSSSLLQGRGSADVQHTIHPASADLPE